MSQMDNTIKKATAKICSATTKNDLPCKKHAMKGASFCYIHSLGRFQDVPIWRNATLHFVVGLFVTIIIAIVSCQYTASRKTQAAMFRQVEYNASLLDDIWISQHESELLQKYPAGYVLFGVDPCSLSQIRLEKRMIPRKGRVLDEYAFKWDRVAIRKLTDESVTIELPIIVYTPLNTLIAGCTMGFNRSNLGRPRILPVRLPGARNRIYMELVYDKPSLLAYVIGFKPE